MKLISLLWSLMLLWSFEALAQKNQATQLYNSEWRKDSDYSEANRVWTSVVIENDSITQVKFWFITDNVWGYIFITRCSDYQVSYAHGRFGRQIGIGEDCAGRVRFYPVQEMLEKTRPPNAEMFAESDLLNRLWHNPQ